MCKQMGMSVCWSTIFCHKEGVHQIWFMIVIADPWAREEIEQVK